MKKFISALTSLVLTATAMGGTLAMSTSAAESSTTELSFCTGDAHSTSITAKPGDKIPVDLYVTKSAGIQGAILKMVVTKDGVAALGQDGRGAAFDDAFLAANEPASELESIKAKMTEAKVSPDLSTVNDHWMYGNYGFTFGMADNADPDNGFAGVMNKTDESKGLTLQLSSGAYCAASEAGKPGSFSNYVPKLGTLVYVNNGASTYDGKTPPPPGYADLYAAFENYKVENPNMTERQLKSNGLYMNTWDGTEKDVDGNLLVYRYPLNNITLTVPEDAVAGDYELTLLTSDVKVAVGKSASAAAKETTGASYYMPSILSWATTGFSTPDGSNSPLTVKSLKITVADEGGSSTESSATTTSTTKTETTTSSTQDSQQTETQKTDSSENVEKQTPAAGTIEFDILPVQAENAFDVTFDGKNNVIKADKGAELVLALYASNDPGCAGQLVYMDFSEVEFVEADVTASSAYDNVAPTANEKYANEADALGQKYVSVVWVTQKTVKAKEGEPICVFIVDVPNEDGTYTISEKTEGVTVKVTDDTGKEVTTTRKTTVEPEDKGAATIPYVFYGLKIVVGEAETETTTSTTTTTTASSDTTTTTTTTASSVTESTDTTTTTTTTVSTEVGDKVWGDTNEDGDVTISDVILLNKALANNAQLSDQAQKNADTDGNNKLSADDAFLIKGYLAKFIDKGYSDVAGLKAMIK